MHPISTHVPPASRPRRTASAPTPTLALLLALALVPVLSLLTAPAARAVEESGTRNETLRWDGAGERVLRVCNIQGSVVARGVSGDTGRLTDRATFRGPSAASVARAQEVMPLEIARHGNVIEVSVGGPCEGEHNHRRDRNDRWEAVHELEIEVPQGVRTELRTINQGEVRLSDHRGPFELANVNGGVTAEDLTGSGSATTVNGAVRVRFAEAPREACTFRSVNGAVDLAFPSDLAASFRFQTLNGEIYTDFDFDMAPRVETVDRQAGDHAKGRYRIRKQWSTAVTIGGGGPEHPRHDIQTVNGDITIRKE
jgi:hypothetical protein